MLKCKICKGEGWVCEDHADKSWGEGNWCCGGAGMPCVCNKTPLARGIGDSSVIRLEFPIIGDTAASPPVVKVICQSH